MLATTSYPLSCTRPLPMKVVAITRPWVLPSKVPKAWNSTCGLPPDPITSTPWIRSTLNQHLHRLQPYLGLTSATGEDLPRTLCRHHDISLLGRDLRAEGRRARRRAVAHGVELHVTGAHFGAVGENADCVLSLRPHTHEPFTQGMHSCISTRGLERASRRE